MGKIIDKAGRAGGFLTRNIGFIIIAFSVLAFFWRDGFSWATNYTSVFLGIAMFGMGLTITANRGQILHGIFLQKLYDVIHHKYLLIGIWVLGIAIFVLQYYNKSVSIYCKVSTLLCCSY